MASVETSITAEEFGRMPDEGRRTELVRGRIVELPPTNFLHGLICGNFAFILRLWLQERDLGRIVINDSGIVTERDPDTLRGADIAYYSYDRLPRGTIPGRYPDVAPDLVIEIRSPSDRWKDVHKKVAEYLSIGVQIVCVLDPEPRTARLYFPDSPPRTLVPDDEVSFPECLPGFGVQVRRFFE